MNDYQPLPFEDFTFTKKSFTIYLTETEFNKIHKGIIKIKNETTRQLQYFTFQKETDNNKIFYNEKLDIILTFIKK